MENDFRLTKDSIGRRFEAYEKISNNKKKYQIIIDYECNDREFHGMIIGFAADTLSPYRIVFDRFGVSNEYLNTIKNGFDEKIYILPFGYKNKKKPIYETILLFFLLCAF